MSNESDNSEEPKMTTSFTFRIEPDWLVRLKKKSGRMPLSLVIRLLLEKWESGEIKLPGDK